MTTTCEAVRLGLVREKGGATVEYYGKNDKPVYFCRGYIDKRTDEYIEICKQCKKHVTHADDEYQKMRGEYR